MRIINILLTLILISVSVFIYYLTVYTIRTYIVCRMQRNQHISIIKRACKDGNFNKLVENCKEVVNDYIAWKNYNELKYFYIKECYLTVFAKAFCEAYRILKYLERADIYRKYQKLNSIYVNKKKQ